MNEGVRSFPISLGSDRGVDRTHFVRTITLSRGKLLRYYSVALRNRIDREAKLKGNRGFRFTLSQKESPSTSKSSLQYVF